jgi:type IV pilus assembly protein PilQ
MKKIILILGIIFFCSAVFCQQEEVEYIDNSFSEQITLARNINFIQALRAIEVLSQLYDNKKILSTSSFNQQIGIPVNQLHWKDALQLIVGYHNLVLEEQPGMYLIRDVEIVKEKDAEEKKLVITPNSQQVRISAIFFKADRSLSKEVGINWHTLIDGNIHVNLTGADDMGDEIIAASIDENLPETFKAGDVTIQLDALFKIVESYQRGAIVARPTITVISGKKGFVQVGQDFSIKTFDQAGNVIDKFYETGMILTVTPKILTENEKKAIHLKIKIEKSSAIPGALTTIINKSKSDTEVLLYDGEETVIGGLYDNDTTLERSGIPILKDLPWWVFGLRYIFGRTVKGVKSNEMIIILKVEIVDSIEDRRLNITEIEEQIEESRSKNTEADKLFEEKK